MRYYTLFALVTLAGFSVVCLFASLAVAGMWRATGHAFGRLAAARRGRWLLTLRLAPTVAAAAAALALGFTFLAYEPPDTGEAAGGVLSALAAISVVMAALAISHAARMVASDSALSRLVRHCRQWTGTNGTAAAILETSYPVAAVAGVFRPRLMLSARVLHECGAEEIEAIVAHERAHMRRHDNLSRALLTALPDRWFAPRTHEQIEAAWTLAAEEAADTEAAGRTGTRRAVLAATLIHVAKMADAAPPAWMPQLAFYQGIGLEYRVRALLAEPRRDSGRIALVEASAIALAICLAGLTAMNFPALHALIEWSVRLLP